MKKDPRQIVTPFAFQVHKDLLGLPLATPKRRLAAILLDFLLASILSALGNFFLASAAAFIFFWVAIRTRGDIWWKNFLRFGTAAIASFLVFGISLGILEAFGPDDKTPTEADLEASGIVIDNASEFNWIKFGQTMAHVDYTNEDSVEKTLQRLALEMADWDSVKHTDFFDEVDLDLLSLQINAFSNSLRVNDSLAIDSIRAEIAPVIAATELNKLEAENEKLDQRNDDLENENENLTDQIENPSIYRMLKSAFGFLGLSLGWIGIYFVMSIAFFKGQTLGKRILNLRVVRLDNKPIGLFYSFERFGGYAAGFATGLLGFFQIYWDANRQAVHDKIAGTVVIDLRESRQIRHQDLKERTFKTTTDISE
jgi:hypothetical protein